MVGFTVNYDHCDFICHKEGRIRGKLSALGGTGDVQVDFRIPSSESTKFF